MQRGEGGGEIKVEKIIASGRKKDEGQEDFGREGDRDESGGAAGMWDDEKRAEERGKKTTVNLSFCQFKKEKKHTQKKTASNNSYLLAEVKKRTLLS